MFKPGIWICRIPVFLVFPSLAFLPMRAADSPKRASEAIPTERLQQYSDLAVDWTQEYLRIDTTNPPGNEMHAAAFFKKILDQEGIENQVFEYFPGRADLWARLPHIAAQPHRPIVLLNHMDVVTSDTEHWKVSPFSGAIVAASTDGRRAQDMKGESAAQLKVLPVVEEFLHEMAPYEPPARARKFRNIRQALHNKKFQEDMERDASLNYLLRDTISLTMLGGSGQTNVIPPDAWANLDVRLLPGEDPKQFLETIRKVVDDPNVTVRPENPEFRIANYSPTNTALFDAIRQVTKQYFPGTPVVPRITSGYTENQRYRPLGINCYGFSPYTATAEEGSTEHGNDERIRVEEARRGPRVLYDVVAAVAAQSNLGARRYPDRRELSNRFVNRGRRPPANN